MFRANLIPLLCWRERLPPKFYRNNDPKEYGRFGKFLEIILNDFTESFSDPDLGTTFEII